MNGDDFREDKSTWPKQAIVPLAASFKDERGEIQPLVERLMRSAMIISSLKGSVRANHYHKTDWHYCFMLTGAMEYFERPTGSTDKPKTLVVRAGQMVFTPPLVDHAMRFLEDTIWVTLSRNPRDPKSYEQDVVRVKLL